MIFWKRMAGIADRHALGMTHVHGDNWLLLSRVSGGYFNAIKCNIEGEAMLPAPVHLIYVEELDSIAKVENES